MRTRPVATLIIAAAVMLAGCVGTSESPDAEDRPSFEASADDGCLEVVGSTADELSARLVGATVADAAAYRSNDHDKIWYVAVELAGPGIEPGETVATFATNDDPTRPGVISGLILPVGEIAVQYSELDQAETATFGLSLTDHGVAESQDCL